MVQVFFVSDHTGITAEMLGRSLLARFEDLDARTTTRPFTDTVAKARDLVAEVNAVEGRALVVSSIALPEVRSEIERADALVLDLFSPYLDRLESFLERAPTERVGSFHGLRDLPRYQARIDAIEYALGTDDGLGTKHYDAAQVILIGVSRVGKTPTCLYLAMHYGVHAANYPVDLDDLERSALPEPLRPHAGRLYGLTIDPARLRQVREARRGTGDYASAARCRGEVRAAEGLFRQHDIPFANTTTRSVEEIAAGIVHDGRMTALRKGSLPL